MSYRGLVAGDTGATPATVTTTATDSSTVGTYSITASGAVQANYTITYVPGTMTVTPVPLTATASNVSRNSGEVNPTLTGTLVGVRNGDQITAAFVTTATTTSPPGTYTITPVLADPDHELGNYTITLVNGSLIVNQNTTTGNTSGTPSPDGQSGNTTSDVADLPSSASASAAGATGSDGNGNHGSSSTSTRTSPSTPPGPAATKGVAAPSRSAATANTVASRRGVFPASMEAANVPGLADRNSGNSRSSTAESSSPSTPPSSVAPIPNDVPPPPASDPDAQSGITVTVSAANARYGQASVTLTAMVKADPASIGLVNEGFVTFIVTRDADPIGVARSTTVTRGVATAAFPLSGVPAGGYSIHAVYEPAGSKPDPWATNPDPRTTSRTTSPATLDVARASTKVTLSSSRNPSIQGQEVTFTAVVSPELGGVSTGTVVFFKDGDDTPLTAIDLGVVNGNSVAIFTTPELPTGVHKLFVEYAGDTNCVGSRSAGSPLIQAVKARGQDMEQKAADEFAGGEGHRSRLR